jgi:glycosyltransferase involved in cell wall biosynthesis
VNAYAFVSVPGQTCRLPLTVATAAGALVWAWVGAWDSAGHRPDRAIVLSVNRFERKKNIRLAVDAFARLAAAPTPSGCPPLQLILAGEPAL